MIAKNEGKVKMCLYYQCKTKHRPFGTMFCGATVGDRTRDLILTMDALYQLSYRGMLACPTDCVWVYCAHPALTFVGRSLRLAMLGGTERNVKGRVYIRTNVVRFHSVSISRFRRNAIPEPDFRYFSKSDARFRETKPAMKITFQGANFDVCFTSPRLCRLSLSSISDVRPL